MNDAESTIAGLKSHECPGGGWNGMPSSMEQATVSDCLAHGVCGCIYGDAVQHIERLRATLSALMAEIDGHCESVGSAYAARQARRVLEQKGPITTEQLDQLQFGKPLHKRP